MRYLRRRSGSGSERTGFMQRRLKADKSWYTPNYRSYKSVNAGPVTTPSTTTTTLSNKELTEQSLEKYGYNKQDYDLVEQPNQWWDFLDWFPDNYDLVPNKDRSK